MARSDPEDWWQTAVSAVKDLNAAAIVFAECVGVVGLSRHMLYMLPVDRSGKPLGASLIHSDTRTESEMEFLDTTIDIDEVYKRTAMCFLPLPPY